MSEARLEHEHQRSTASSVTVDDLLITSELERRSKRRRDGATGPALQELSRQIGENPSDVLPRFVVLAQLLCGGGSAGVSIYEPQPDGAGIFRWSGLSGKAAAFNGKTTPRDLSPCGVCLDKAEIILMERPGRYYDWLNLPDVPLTEVLFVPMFIRGKTPFGTLWIMSHDAHQFDSEDARALREIASFACLVIGLLADIADERARAEQAKQQATKMETLGQLTGGIAHDFNNLLTVLAGQLELIKMSVEDVEIIELADRGLASASSGERLVKRLLAFARRKPLRTEVIEPGPVLVEIVETLTRFFATLDVRSQIGEDLWPVVADRTRLESAMLNLAINARDAMNYDGGLTIEARNAWFENGSDDQGLSGDFVALSVSDTGSGMSPEILERVFEPFFTTKDIGIGTGLGLSMVQEFATQSGGTVRAQSEIGKGTTITIHLPRAALAASAPQDGASAA
jgi:signal transduction histidine kinase